MAKPHIRMSSAAFASMRETLRTALPKEAGGILVGWRDGADVIVADALLVPDGGAQATHYVRRYAAASEVLDAYMETATDPLAGYVGEWHTHPAAVPPSQIDEKTIANLAVQSDSPVALVVLAWDRSRDDADFHGVVARRIDERITLVPACCVRVSVSSVDG
jgi:integrative and conjugative element protein (TIGR02256 family)